MKSVPQKDLVQLWNNPERISEIVRQQKHTDEISLHRTSALKEEVGRDEAIFTYISFWFHSLTLKQRWLAKPLFPRKKRLQI